MVRKRAQSYKRSRRSATLEIESVGSPALWAGFLTLILALLALDLGVLHRKDKEVSLREAAGWTAVWVSLAAAFGGFVWFKFGSEAALQYYTGYVVEEALSVDNVFVFSVILTFFGVPKLYQHRVLFWGILGALILRGVFIGAGAALLHNFHWVMYIFGAVLVYTGIKLLFHDDDDVDPSKNALVRIAKRLLPVTDSYQGNHFFVRQHGKLAATPLFLVLLAVEGTDVIFAVDSIPAIFAITKDPFIVYTSNIFAILGLRSLYFLVAGMIDKFHYLKLGLSGILMFIGVKMLISDIYHVHIAVSLAVIVGTLIVAIIASAIRARRLEKEGGEEAA
jgi:tellurite resistance protein TerC